MTSPLKLKVDLQDLPHKVTRTLLVPEKINIRQLHFIIQESFGWFNAHLFEFSDRKFQPRIRIGMPDDFDLEFEGPPKIDAHKIKLKDAFLSEKGSKAFFYNYDFGDDWWHRISVLKLNKKDLKNFEGIPLCIKAEGKCPPEDVGGTWGYEEFLTIIKDESHPEHKEMGTWYGLEKDEKFDESQVDLEEINQLLSEFFHSKFWKAKIYDSYD